VFAQETEQVVAAQALFDQAKALMNAGNFADACPKLEESQRLDPSSGTLINLAECYERTGKLASAWATFLDAEVAARSSGNAARQEVAHARAFALEPRLPRIAIQVAKPDIPGLEIRRGHAVVGAPQWGVPIPLDPGEHVISASAPGHVPWSTRIVAREAAPAVTIAVPALEPHAKASAPVGAAARPLDRHEPAPAEAGLGTQRTLALVAGGVGVIGVVVGSVFGLKSMSSRNDADPYCDEDSRCWDHRAYDAAEDAVTAGNLSTLGFLVGGLGLAGGAVLWFTAPSTTATESAALGVGPASMRVKVAF
jgi:hypothetical protein